MDLGLPADLDNWLPPSRAQWFDSVGCRLAGLAKWMIFLSTTCTCKWWCTSQFSTNPFLIESNVASKWSHSRRQDDEVAHLWWSTGTDSIHGHILSSCERVFSFQIWHRLLAVMLTIVLRNRVHEAYDKILKMHFWAHNLKKSIFHISRSKRYETMMGVWWSEDE